MPLGPQAQLRQPVECVVCVDDAEITQLYPYLREVQVSMSRRAATTATLVFDSVRLEDGQWSVQDAGILKDWKPIRIEAVFGEEHIEVMRGYIKEVACDYPDDMSAARVTVNAQDDTLLLDREHVRAPLSSESEPKSDQQIISAIARDRNLGFEGEAGLTHASLNIDGTYIQFLRERADANGFELYVREGVLHFHLPKLDQQLVEPILLYAGPATNCLRFAVRYDGHKPDQVVVKRTDSTGKEVQVGTPFTPRLRPLGKVRASSESQGLQPFVWIMQASGGASDEEIQLRAQAKAEENSWKISAEGELDGAIYGRVLFTCELVTVDGAGPTHSGTYYVDEVQHKFSLEGYRIGFKLLRNATGEDIVAAPANPIANVA